RCWNACYLWLGNCFPPSNVADGSLWRICPAKGVISLSILLVIKSFLTSRISPLKCPDCRFCGDWAGAVYASQGCPGTCTDRVAWYPSSFNQAYFGVKSL